MSEKSKKPILKEKPHTFVGEPIMDKPVTELCGIGEVLGERLKAARFDRAYNTLGKESKRRLLKLIWEFSKMVPSIRVESNGRAYQVLGQFLVLKKNKRLFMIWLKDVCGANTTQATECYECLADWCNEFL